MAAEGGLGLLGDQIDIQGGEFAFDSEANAAVLSRYAKVRIDTVTITARNMVFYRDTNEVYAEGDVSFDDSTGSAFFCDQMYFNPNTWEGLAYGVRVKGKIGDASSRKQNISVSPKFLSDERHQSQAGIQLGDPNRAVVHAREMRSIDRNHQEVIGAVITPSFFAKPHWGLYAASANFRKDEKVESYHNILKIRGIPVFYFPYIIKDLRYEWPWVRVTAGTSEDFGPFVYTKIGLDFDENIDRYLRLNKVFFDADYRDKRGWAYGAELEYLTGNRRSLGFIDFYTTQEEIDPSDDWNRAEEDNLDSTYRNHPDWKPSLYEGERRHTFSWWHQQDLTDRWDLRFEAHKQSDRDFLREYFRDRYDEDKELETSVDLRFLHDDFVFEVVGQKRLNDWQNQSEYLPELRLSVPGLRLFDTNLYLRGDYRAGLVQRRYDELFFDYGVQTDELAKLPAGEEETGTFFRAHQDTRLYAPLRLPGDFVFTPEVGARTTYYGETANEGEGDTSSAFLWGARLSNRFFGTFADGKVRHVFEPSVSFMANEKPDLAPGEIYYIDDIDAYDESHVFTVNLHNAIQSRAGGSTRNVLDFDVRFRVYPDEEEQDRINYGRAVSDIYLDLIWRPTTNLTVFGDALYDPEYTRFNRWTAGARTNLLDTYVAVRNTYRRGGHYRSPNSEDSLQTTLTLSRRLWNEDSNYRGSVSITYEWRDTAQYFSGLVEESVSLYRDFDTVELGLTYFRNERNDDQGFYVQLIPKGWVGVDRDPGAEVIAQRESEYRYSMPALDEEALEAPAPGLELETTPGPLLEERPGPGPDLGAGGS